MEPRVRARINAVIILVFLTLTSIFVLYPIVYIIAAAFSPGTSIASLNIVPFGDGVTLEHFRHLFQNTNYVIWFKNTLIIALATSISTVIIASLRAYVFSRFRFTLKEPDDCLADPADFPVICRDGGHLCHPAADRRPR